MAVITGNCTTAGSGAVGSLNSKLRCSSHASYYGFMRCSLAAAATCGEDRRANGVDPAAPIGESQWGGRNGPSGVMRNCQLTFLHTCPFTHPHAPQPTYYSIANRQTSAFHLIRNPTSAPDECQLRCRCCSYASAAGCFHILLDSRATY